MSQYLTFYAVSSYSNLLATKAAKSIELYKEYKDANIELEGFESQYKYVIKNASKCEIINYLI